MLTIDENTVRSFTQIMKCTKCYSWDLYNPYTKIVLRNEQIKIDRENNILSMHEYYLVYLSGYEPEVNLKKLLPLQPYLNKGYIFYRGNDNLLCDCLNIGYIWNYREQKVIQTDDYSFIHNDIDTLSKAEWFYQWLAKQDLKKDLTTINTELKRREDNPDWERPIVMYGIRKKHKCIKKNEIGIVIDFTPWQQRARTAETHWYHILYKRPVTDKEWEIAKANNPFRRYTIWHYYINGKWSIDKIISHIVQQATDKYQIDEYIIRNIISAFEKYYKQIIRISRVEEPEQLSFSF